MRPLEQMRAEGCTEVQGHACSKSVPKAQIGDVLADFGRFFKAAA